MCEYVHGLSSVYSIVCCVYMHSLLGGERREGVVGHGLILNNNNNNNNSYNDSHNTTNNSNNDNNTNNVTMIIQDTV